jgi:hypothetical protein
MTTIERNRHNSIVMQIHTAIGQIRYGIDEPGYYERAATTLRNIAHLALGEAHALAPEVK